MYTDHMIYSPHVPIIKNEEGDNLDTLQHCAIITAPAVNAGVVKRKEPEKVAEIETVMKRRIRKVLSIALENNHEAVVLGAWGCGVFQNDPKEVAKYFSEIINYDFKNRFKEIIFAIYSKNKPFRTEIGYLNVYLNRQPNRMSHVLAITFFVSVARGNSKLRTVFREGEGGNTCRKRRQRCQLLLVPTIP